MGRSYSILVLFLFLSSLFGVSFMTCEAAAAADTPISPIWRYSELLGRYIPHEVYQTVKHGINKIAPLVRADAFSQALLGKLVVVGGFGLTALLVRVGLAPQYHSINKLIFKMTLQQKILAHVKTVIEQTAADEQIAGKYSKDGETRLQNLLADREDNLKTKISLERRIEAQKKALAEKKMGGSSSVPASEREQQQKEIEKKISEDSIELDRVERIILANVKKCSQIRLNQDKAIAEEQKNKVQNIKSLSEDGYRNSYDEHWLMRRETRDTAAQWAAVAVITLACQRLATSYWAYCKPIKNS